MATDKERLGKHVTAAMDTHATIGVLLETEFSMVFQAEWLYGVQPFSEDLSPEEEKQPLPKAVTR
jgi:hypothetical protein